MGVINYLCRGVSNWNDDILIPITDISDSDQYIPHSNSTGDPKNNQIHL